MGDGSRCKYLQTMEFFAKYWLQRVYWQLAVLAELAVLTRAERISSRTGGPSGCGVNSATEISIRSCEQLSAL
jgi:hypothetical protein